MGVGDNPVWKACKPFATGSLAGMFATTCIQPIDMVKVRIQLLAGTAEAAGPVSMGSNMLKNEGIAAFYKGLDAGLTRQVVYTGARLGLFDKFTAMVKTPGKSLSFLENAGCALSAGGLAALLGNPADLALIRMQADSMKPAAERAGYTSVVTTMGMILKADGPGGLMAGAGPTATRAMALNFGMLAFNASAKDALGSAGVTGAPQVFGASAIAGFFCIILFLAVRLCEISDAESEAMPDNWRTSVQELGRLRHENYGRRWSAAFLRWFSDVLRSHSATCNDHTYRTRLYQEKLAKDGPVRQGVHFLDLFQDFCLSDLPELFNL